MARTLSITALAVLAEGTLRATATGLTGAFTGRSYPKRITDPLFREGLLTTTVLHLFTKGVRITPKGEQVLRESRQATLDAESRAAAEV